mgnify:CR=1 FL=1
MSSKTFLKPSIFGKAPSGKRLERIKQSPNYRNNAFQNQSATPDLTDGATYFSVVKDMLFKKDKRREPNFEIPSLKTNLLSLNPNENVLVWFGHSSYFMQIDGKKFLVDPVLSGNASPVSFTTKAFKGSDNYKVEDLPFIDYLIITHDHYDHLDYKTILKLKPKVAHVITSLGTGEHLEHWGYSTNSISETDWYETLQLSNGFTLHATPSRHFSGRGLKRNQALWTSFVLQTPSLRIFIGGDSGYDKHFAEIGNMHGPFDLAILENGQYNKNWKHIHLLPDEILQAAIDLKTKKLLPVHSSKFALALHAWDEPLEKLMLNNLKVNLPILTPMIGETVNLLDEQQVFQTWWRK